MAEVQAPTDLEQVADALAIIDSRLRLALDVDEWWADEYSEVWRIKWDTDPYQQLRFAAAQEEYAQANACVDPQTTSGYIQWLDKCIWECADRVGLASPLIERSGDNVNGRSLG